MAIRIYSVDMRTFEITLTQTPAPTSAWTIESVKETSDGGRDLAIPGVYSVRAAAEEIAFAHACDDIDKWLIWNRAGIRAGFDRH